MTHRPILSNHLYEELKQLMNLPDNARRIVITLDLREPSVVEVECDLIGQWQTMQGTVRTRYHLVPVDDGKDQ